MAKATYPLGVCDQGRQVADCRRFRNAPKRARNDSAPHRGCKVSVAEEPEPLQYNSAKVSRLPAAARGRCAPVARRRLES